ncbi:hypothetical protein TNCV_1691191 [Trichonephila clavipes]|nr:hypothetical protein TNCV_1691191 [Trichonephila clavipes]
MSEEKRNVTQPQAARTEELVKTNSRALRKEKRTTTTKKRSKNHQIWKWKLELVARCGMGSENGKQDNGTKN